MSSPRGQSAGVWLLDVATAIGLFTALVYVAGWTYAYHYFGHFSLGLLQLQIPRDYYFMYGFWVLKQWALPLGALYLLVLLPFPVRDPWCWGLLTRWRGDRPLFLKHLQVLAILLIFVLIWWLAIWSAGSYYSGQQARRFVDYPNVQVWLNTDPKHADLLKLHTGLAEGGYRLLLQNQEKLFLFKPPRDGGPARLATVEVFLKDVETLRVLP